MWVEGGRGWSYRYEVCDKNETEDRKCTNCGCHHLAAFTGCTTFQEAREISRIKVTEKISYEEAIKKYEL